MDDYLCKPFNPQELFDMLEKLIVKMALLTDQQLIFRNYGKYIMNSQKSKSFRYI